MSGDIGNIFFGALKYLQEKIPIEIFAIIDKSDNSKEFFNDQKFVKFKKVWFYKEHAKLLHSPDISYLKQFEMKYGMNLSQIIFADPTFAASEEPSKFSENEVYSLLEDDCKLYEDVIEKSKPDFLIIHTGGQKQLNVLKEICKARSVKILQLAAAKFGRRTQISEEYDVFDKIVKPINIADSETLTDAYLQELDKKINLAEYYKKRSETIVNKKISFIFGVIRNYFSIKNQSTTMYTNLKDSNMLLRLFVLMLKNVKREKRKRFLFGNSTKEIIPDEKFVYFALHMQPEHTTSVIAPFFTEQISLVRNIARSLPVNYVLYVKEHPSMGTLRYWRDKSFYEKILDMPNVRLIDPRVSSSLLYEKSEMAITITGSASYEAILFRKPVLVFGNVGNMGLPSVTRIRELEDLSHVIRHILESPFDDNGCKRYFEQKFRETIIINESLQDDLRRLLYLENTDIDDITNDKMDEFLKRSKNELSIIADEFLRKIKDHKINQ